MTVVAGTQLCRYEIRSKIGAGGMGEVYLAQDTSELGRTVALKILPAEIAKDKDRLHRFTQEARTVSNLNHPNILTVHEFGRTDSFSFFATEYVDGITLREHLSKRRLKLVDVLDAAIQIVGALNAAHEAGVTHRDLKPDNVMIRKDHIVKVLDFGLAKLSEQPASARGSNPEASEEVATKVFVHTEPGLVMGTVSYMSPEQSAGHAVDHRTDIWSAGVVLYEMIAGVVPFQGKDIHRQIIAIQEQEPAPLSQQVEGVPERLEEIVSKCLAKEKGERYQTAKDLLIDLRNLRRKLDVDAEIERTVAPALRSTSAGASAGTHASQAGVGSSVTATSTASSAEYVVTGLKQHKLEFYRQAIEKDPNYARAYAGLAETYVIFPLYSLALPNDIMPKAKAMAGRALEIDDSLAEAHAALGSYLTYFEYDRTGAEREYRRAIELNPNYATAHHWLGNNVLNPTKRFDEALVELRRAEELDPLSPIIGTNLGDSFVYTRQYDEAISQYKRVLALDPNFAFARYALGWAYYAKGMYREAIAEFRKSLELSYDPSTKGYLGLSLANAGQRDEAIKLLDQLKQESSGRYVMSSAIAVIYIGLNEKDEALNWLEKEVAERSSYATFIAVDPVYDDLRSDPDSRRC